MLVTYEQKIHNHLRKKKKKKARRGKDEGDEG